MHEILENNTLDLLGVCIIVVVSADSSTNEVLSNINLGNYRDRSQAITAKTKSPRSEETTTGEIDACMTA
jgi:hypothetical protein